jgi:hypothetical protein
MKDLMTRWCYRLCPACYEVHKLCVNLNAEHLKIRCMSRASYNGCGQLTKLPREELFMNTYWYTERELANASR